MLSMFSAPILIAGLLTTTAHPPDRASLVSQMQSHATQLALSTEHRAPSTEHLAPGTTGTDRVWDGALAGALAGAGAGAVTALVIYGQGDGEWPDQRVVVGGLTFYGAIIGGVTGLVIDLVRK